MSAFIIPLSQVAPQQRAQVGGKAVHLGRLVDRGLPVPEGFAVPTDAFVATLQRAGLTESAKRIAASVDDELAVELREGLLSASLDPGFERALVDAARRLGPRVAVRSSGVEEDGKLRSWAGQFETVLGVRPEDVPAALLRCWASYYRPETLAYRGATGASGPPPGGMGVVVQRLVEPRTSGVMFTVNPMSGSWREMTVEATWGLGEGLVSGQVAPHWFLIRRPRKAPRPVERALARVRLQLVQEDLPEIGRMWGLRGGEVGEIEVPGELRHARTLDRSTLFRLCRLGLRVERTMGEPQDVEWALDDAGRLHLLQARPITATGHPRSRTDVLWTRRFIGERWPEPATPLGWSLMAPVIEHFIAYPETQARHLGGGPALRLVQSRPYINASVFPHLAFKLPGAPAPRFMLELMPPEEVATWQRAFAVKPDLGVYASIIRTTVDEKRWQRFRWNPFTNHRVWDEVEERLNAELPALERTPISVRDAMGLVDAQLELVRVYVGVHVCSLLFANIWDQVLEGFLAVWLPEDAVALREGLAVCPPGNLTLATNEALWTLAQQATDADVEALRTGSEPSEAFAERLASFLEVYGHRSEASWEVFSVRWRDAPEALAPMLDLYRSGGAEHPGERAERQQRSFELAEARLASASLTPARRRIVEYLIFLVRRYLLLRENQRFLFDRLLYAMQTTFRWAGTRFTERGWLERADDIDFLTHAEVRGLADGSLPPDGVGELVARRRAQREEDRQRHPPVFLRGDEAVAVDETGARLLGLGISPGRVRGRVRVVRSMAESGKLQPGEVLVTRAVDPGWTPLFLTAGAVVLEMGSRLSHGAVVAREYGLPAVVNIDDVTSRLRDGQEVTVDGTRGIVWVHP